MFPGGEDAPLFTNCPVPVPEPSTRRRQAISQEQGLLLEPACRTCMDTGQISVGADVKYCWCAAGAEAQFRKRSLNVFTEALLSW
jgi:hypothetical protein